MAKYLPYGGNLVKIGGVDPDIILSQTHASIIWPSGLCPWLPVWADTQCSL